MHLIVPVTTEFAQRIDQAHHRSPKFVAMGLSKVSGKRKFAGQRPDLIVLWDA